MADSRHGTEIILVRHGETEFNVAGKLQGTLDSPLTAKGVSTALSHIVLPLSSLQAHSPRQT